MPIAPRSNSSAERRRVLVAALSGRALAAAAHRARERVAVLDLFADEDTARLAESCVRLPAAGAGFDRAALLAAIDALAPAAQGLVYGAGFEHDPALLTEIATRVPLIGNAPETVAAVKDPLRLADCLARLGLPHPEIRREALAMTEGAWLRKTAGGAGGSHISVATGDAPASGTYFQRRVPGRPLSALFAANGRTAQLLGFSEQWADGTSEAPFRYGGCAGPVAPAPRLADAIAEACDALAAAAGLVGLNSLDLMVEDERFQIIEINPRPGATLDLFDGLLPLWRIHLDAVSGQLPGARAASGLIHAAAILYAPAALAIPRDMAWPGWASDRGPPGSRVPRDAPLCTVHAAAKSVAAARARLAQRADRLLARLAGGTAASA
jgi:predicted ATP-grasp superfamily ATP-dependent carboligase